MMVKNIKSVGVLVAICAVVALLLALTNQITAPIIKDNEARKAAAALKEVLPDGALFEEMDLKDYKGKLPATVTKVYEETAGEGYVIELTTKGFNPDMVIMCGVTPDGIVRGAKCTKAGETLGYEKTYGANFKDKDAAGVEAVDTVGGATMTTGTYKQAIKDAINTVLILGGAEVDLRSEEEKAVDKMKEDLGATEEADLSQYALPESVTKAFVGDKGYVIYLTVSGYQPGMEIVCGVGTDNKIVGAVCLKSNETNGKEKEYGNSFVGKDAAGVDAVDTIAGSTMTTTGYKQAMKDAINTALVLGGEEVDIRTPEQILQDNLSAALPAGEGKFSKLFLTEVLEGVDAVYAADNGAGFVAVSVAEEIGEEFTGEFIGIDANMNIVTAGSTANTDAAYTAVQTIKASSATDITADLAAKMDALLADTTLDRNLLLTYRGIKGNVTSVNKTATGNYVFEIKGAGYGINGGDQYHPASGEYIVIRVSITADGKIIDCLTVSQKESENIGDVCAKEEFSSRFDGKTEADIAGVDGIAGATLTTKGYKDALLRCFVAVQILEGGAE